MWPLRQEPPRPPFCVSEASLNGQPLTLWSPLLGQIWEGESGGGWGFSKSGNLKKSSGEAGFEVPAHRGWGGRGRCRSCCLGSEIGAQRNLLDTCGGGGS